ncbi:branched-chain amino acid ABC transporter permease [Aquincola sp. MAHUQ-54]|uniref:Branched-chain amino acid ABC transporter permease n=1 Tax=Aquincola agrisoli TaxID=3119538 RepID=A0AAW9QJ47_9BURK
MRSQFLLPLAGVLVLAVLPAVLPSGLLNASVQMLISALFACAYSLLSGRAGMLSFGHAAYFGVGAFATAHAMNALGGAGLLPTPLLPLAGGLVGLLVGVAAGWFATQRAGTAFAMITLAIAELLHSLAPQLPGWFGGESGVSTMRMPAWGLDFGSTVHVYYVALAWVLLSLACLYFHAQTPLGRLTLGLRENAHRLRFLGYDVHGLGVSAFALSAMFSGVAGGLQVLSNEAVNYVVFDASVSAAVVLNSYIGGVGTFLGPALGAAVMTFFGYAVSDTTQLWLLYQGVLFVLVMMFVPQGITGVFLATGALMRRHGAARVLPGLAASAAAVLLLAAGTVFLMEALQRLCSQDYRSLARMGEGWPPLQLFGRAWAPDAASTWLLPLALLAAGAAVAPFARRRITDLQEQGTA